MANVPISKMQVPGSEDVLLLRDSTAANKVQSPTSGNLASLDASGNLADSGWASDKTTTAVSGNPINITGLKTNQLAKNPIITLEPIQAGSGDPSPSNIRAISGRDKLPILSVGKNLFDSVEDGGIDDYGGESVSSVRCRSNDYISVAPSTQYTFKATTNQSKTLQYLIRFFEDNLGSYRISDSGWIITESYTFTTPSNCKFIKVVFSFNDGSNIGKAYITNVQLEKNDQATTYEPCIKATDLTLQFGQTVYGGTLDLENGVLRSTDANIASYNGETLPSTWISDRDVYAAGRTPTTGAQVVYKLATPIEIKLTPHEISLLSGVANASIADAGASMSFSYHNGEMASLGDVEQLAETVNELGSEVSEVKSKSDAHTFGYRHNLSQTNANNKYICPCDGYVRLYSEISAPLTVIISDELGRTDSDHLVTVGFTGASTTVSVTYVKKGMRLWINPNTPFTSPGHLAMFHPIM